VTDFYIAAGARSSADGDAVAITVGDLCRLHGEFTLRSGTHASTYFDKYLFEAEPTVLTAVALRLADLVPPDTKVLASLAGGDRAVAHYRSPSSVRPQGSEVPRHRQAGRGC